ncbi:hypothetical protein RUND412_006926 [Rhizina undulata]
MEEFRLLENGIPAVRNSARKQNFRLHAHITLVGADMPGREKLLNFMGNRAYSYCPYCYARGVLNRAIYCPCEPPIDTYEDRKTSKADFLWPTYNPANLPLRNDEEIQKIAKHVVQNSDSKIAKKYGVRGILLLGSLSSINFPHFFPPDSMNLFFENLVPDIFKHYRGAFFRQISDGTLNEQISVLEEENYDGDNESNEISSKFHTQGKYKKSAVISKVNGARTQKGNGAMTINDPWIIKEEAWSKIGKIWKRVHQQFRLCLGSRIEIFITMFIISRRRSG